MKLPEDEVKKRLIRLRNIESLHTKARKRVVVLEKENKKLRRIIKELKDENNDQNGKIEAMAYQLEQIKIKLFGKKPIVKSILKKKERKERMKFLSDQSGVVHLGAHGATLVFDQKRDQLPKGKWYLSFDEKERLWKDAHGYHRVPFLNAYSVGDFYLDLSYFEYVLNRYYVILSFCDEQS